MMYRSYLSFELNKVSVIFLQQNKTILNFVCFVYTPKATESIAPAGGKLGCGCINHKLGVQHSCNSTQQSGDCREKGVLTS